MNIYRLPILLPLTSYCSLVSICRSVTLILVSWLLSLYRRCLTDRFLSPPKN